MADRNLFGLNPLDRAIAEFESKPIGLGLPQLGRPGQTPDSEPLEGAQAATGQDRPHVPGVSKSLAPPPEYRPIFENTARKYNVPVNILMALGHQESRYNPNARGPMTQWGDAHGMMQYLGATAKNLGINPYDPEQAIDAAARQIRERLDKGYSMEDAVKEHFAGPNRKLWGAKTRAYGSEVLAKARAIRAELYSQPQQQETADFDSMIGGRERTQGNMSVMADGPMSVPAGTDMDRVRDVARIPDALPEPQQSWEDRSWFERYVTDRLGAGWKGLQAGMASNAAGFYSRILDVIDRIDRGEQVPDMDDPLGYQHMNAEQRAQAKQQVGDAFIKSLGDTARLNKEQQAIPQHPEVQAALQSETFSEFWDHFSKAPVTFITSVGLESLPQMAPGLVMGGVVGALTRTAGGFAAGMGAGSYATDYAASVLQALGENGIDVTNQEQLQKAFQDKALMEQVRKSAHAHASVVGTADAVSGGVAGKAIISGKTVGRKMANTAAQMPVQGALGAGGEVGGQLAQGKRPEDIKAGEVAAEFFDEMATAPIDVAAAGLAARREQRNEAQQPDPQADAEPAQRAPLALPAPTIEVGPDGTATTASQRNAQRNAESISREAEARRRYQTGQDGRVTPYEATDGVVVSEDGQILAPGATAWSPEQQPIDTRGPLARAMDKGVEAAQQQAAASEQAAVENGLPAVGTQVVLDPGTGEAIPAVVAEYVGNEIVFQDQTGNALQIPIPEALQVMRLPEQIDPETGEVQDGEIVSGDATVLPDVRGSGVEDTQEVGADQPQGTQAGGEVSGGRQGASEVDGTGVGENLVAATGPAEQPRTLNIEDMTLEQLQESRQYISDQARAGGGWNKTLVQERDRVDAAINRIEAGNVQAPKDVKPRPTNVTTQGGKPLVELYHAREGVKVLVRKDQWEDGRADLPTFNNEGKRQSGTLMNVPRSLLRTPEQEADIAEQADAVIDRSNVVEPDVIPESAQVDDAPAAEQQEAPAKAKSPKDAIAEQFKQETGVDIAKAGPILAGIEMRNNMRKNGTPAGSTPTLEMEAEPFTPEQMRLLDQWEAMRNPSSKFLFHTTTPDRIQSIAENGLKPGAKQRFEGVSASGRLSFGANEATAAYYGGQGDVMLRVSKKHKLSDLDVDMLAGDGAYTSSDTIPPEAIEAKVGGKWVPLKDAVGKLTAKKPEAKPKTASKEDLDRLFGVDQKRAKALERIANGRAWFGDQKKARDFITKNGLKDTHEAVQTGAKRWEAQAKADQPKPVSNPAIDELRNQVTGAIERGEKEPVTEQKAQEDMRPSAQSGEQMAPVATQNLASQLAGMSNAELSSLIDEIAAEDTQVVDTAKPVAKRKRRTLPKTGAAKPRDQVSQAEAADTADNADVQRTAQEIAQSLGYNVSSAGMQAIEGLTKLFGGSGKLNSGLTFDEETYAQAKPHFQAMLSDAQAAGKDVADFIRLVLQKFGTGVKPYIIRFANDLRDGPVTGEQDAGNAIYEDGAGPLEEVEAGDVQGTEGQRNAERGSAAGQQGRGQAGSATDGGGVSETRGRGSRAPRNNTASPGRKRVSKAKEQVEQQLPDLFEAAPEAEIAQASAPNIPATNFVIDDSLELGRGTEGQKYQDNVAAIKTLKQIEQDGRRATPEEQRILARYVGWGGLKNAFRVAGAKEGQGVAKGWEGRVQELEELLTPDELRAARNSTTAAHYTSQAVVQAIWRGAERLGFNGGSVLEPSVGTGNFIGLMPESVRGSSKVLAVEYDSLTARIAQQLYPQSTILHSGFESVPTPRNYFALAIGNPPFGRESLTFKGNPSVNGKSIHNQFFLASLDAVAEDGLMGMVVSHNLMDALGKDARLDMAAKAHFIGAIRLPDTAFKENARTEVVTDILFFRKRNAKDADLAQRAVNMIKGVKDSGDRLNPEDLNMLGSIRSNIESWVNSQTVQMPDKTGVDAPVNVNGYFLANPRMVLGRMDASGTMNARADLNVRLDDPSRFDALLNEAIDRLPQSAPKDDVATRSLQHYETVADALRLAVNRAEPGAITKDADGKLKMVVDMDGGDLGKSVMREIELTADTPFNEEYTLTLDGKWQRTVDLLGEDGKPVKVKKDGRTTNRNEKQVLTYDSLADIPAKDKWGAERVAIVNDMLPIRNLMKRQLMLEAADANERMIEENRARLNKAYDGFVEKHGQLHSQKVAKIALMMPDGALALAAETVDGKGAKAKYGKADIMSRRVTMPPKPAEKASSPADAVAISLSEYGGINVERIASLLGTDEAGAIEAISNPDAALAYFNPETQVWESADQYLSGPVRRKLLAAKSAGLESNIAALEKVIPEDWDSSQITPNIGSAWIPGTVYADFIKHLGYKRANVSYSAVTNAFDVRYEGEPTAQWQTSGRAHPPANIVSRLLNSQTMKVTYTDNEGKTYVDEEATAETQIKANEIFNEFLDWVYTDDDRRNELVRIFNEKYNTRVVRQYDGSHLQLPGKVPDQMIKMRRHQKNAIWRGIIENAVLYDHVVGAGKAGALDSKLLTPKGWILMGDVRVGDYVITQSGKPTRVEAIYPQGEKEIFKVTFSDGSSTECCDEHLWLTWNYSERGYAQRAKKLGKNWASAMPKVRPLSEIRETLVAPHLGAKNHSIPMVEAVEFEPQAIPLDPYLLGALIGDGNFTHNTVKFTKPDRELVYSFILPEGCYLREDDYEGKTIGWGITGSGGRNPVLDALRELGLQGHTSHSKFVPDAYKFNTPDVRLAVLRGLMDTDGWVEKNGRTICFSTASERLADDVTFLVQSFGGTTSKTVKTPHYTYKGQKLEGAPAYLLTIKMPPHINPFHTSSKANKVVAKTKYAPVRYIVSVESVGKKPAQCIQVADPSHLYVTDDFIVTHNTYTAIARIMERRRMGMSRKPMVVVPNHLIEQWASDVTKLYPGANVLAAGKADFERKNRRKLFARIASGDYDMVIIGHSSFGFIEIDPSTEQRYIEEELRAANEAIEAAKEAAEEAGFTGFRKPLGVAEAERLVKKLESRLEKLRAGNRDRLLTFEEMGIDDLTVDEAHEFKNLAYNSNLTGVSGMGNKTGSQKAMDVHIKVRSLRERQGTSVAFLTGTPISNSVAEMFLVLKNLVPNELKELGIDNFDAWRSMFVSYAAAYEPTEAGGVKEVTRLGREWMNMKSLMDLYYSVSDAVTLDDIKKAFSEDNPGKEFPVPKVKSQKDGKGDRAMVAVKPSAEQRAILREIVSGFESLQGISDLKERNAMRLRLMDRARKVSLDPRAVDPTIKVSSKEGKLPAVVDNVARIYNKWNDDKGTQVIFLDRSVPKAKGDDKKLAEYDALREKLRVAMEQEDEAGEAAAVDALAKYNANEMEEIRNALAGGWNAYDEIKRQLVEKGIPENEIRFVQEANTDEQKKALFNLVKSGTVRVLIGSTPRMGAGTNVQDRLVALHHVDVTWKPSDIEQREGRIVRQGNLLLDKYGDDFEVEIIAYATEMTVDAKMWALNATKLKAINGIRKYDGSFMMEFEDEESANMAEMAALATGNPLMVERVTLTGDIQKLELQQRSYKNRVNSLRDSLNKARRMAEQGPKDAEQFNAYADTIEQRFGPVSERSAKRSLTVAGKTYNNADDASLAAGEAIEKARKGDEKARFSVEVGGNNLTSQSAIEDAIQEAFGTPDFEATIDGKTIIGLTDASRVLAEKVGRAIIGAGGRDIMIDGISINGMKVEIDIADQRFNKSADKDINFLLVNDSGESMGRYRSVLTSGVPTQGGMRAGLVKLFEKLDPREYRLSAKRLITEAKEAEKKIPGLQEQIAKPWDKAQELEDKRNRLKEVISQLESASDSARLADDAEGEEDGTRFSVAPQTDTAAFKRWFGDSKVVDDDGNPLVVYHGTRHSFDEFKREGRKGNDRLHYFSDNPAVANEYAGDVRYGSPNVMPAYVSLQKPFTFDAGGELWGSLPLDLFPSEIAQHFDERNILRGRTGQAPRIGFTEVIRGALAAGYDGVIADQIRDGGGPYGDQNPSKVVVASRPEQIKSATGNIGTFDPANPDIRLSAATDTGTPEGMASQEQNALMRHADVMNALRKGPLGSVIDTLIGKGHITVHPTERSLPRAVRAKGGAVQAYTDKDGRIHLAAQNLTRQTAMPVVLHEGFHGFGEKLIGTKKWNAMMRRMADYQKAARKRKAEGRVKEGDFYDQALRRVDAAIARGAIAKGREAEEFAAYAIESYELTPAGIKKWVDDFIGMVKDWLARRFNIQVGEITPAQLRAFAVAALRSAEGTMPQVNASLGGSVIGSGALSTQSRGTDSPAFRRWFGDSKVVDADGNPLVVYHGTNADFSVFNPGREGNAIFVAFDPKSAEQFGQRNVDYNGGNLSVMPVYVKAEKPFDYTNKQDVDAIVREMDKSKDSWGQGIGTKRRGGIEFGDWEVIESPIAQAAIHDLGYDGYYVKEGGKRNLAVFNPEQIKSATGNIGTFDPENADIRFSVSDNEPRLTHRTIIERLSDGLDNMKPSVLAAIPLNYFEELARPAMKDAVKAYMKLKRSMDAYRGERHAEADQTAQKWIKLRAFNRQEAKELATLMHDSTLRQVDPSTSKEDPDLSKRYSNLSTEAKALYKEVRDAYRKQSDELDSILVENIKNAMDLAVAQAERRYNERMQQIKDEGLKGEEREAAEAAAEKAFKTASTKARWSRNARVTALRKSFESNRLAGPYFPLARFGNYFVTVRDVDGSVISFSRKETVGQMRRLAKDMAAAYPSATIETGMLSNKSEVEGAIDPRFVVEIEEILGDAAVDDEVRDQIWQRYLESMPDMSARKRFIHRKGTEGYENDALRAFSNHMFHAAHQMARLKFGPQMLEQVNKVEDSAKASDDPVRGMQLSNEMRRRHKWVMNPTGSRWAQFMTSLGFVWYLGLTPAAAIVNLSQTVLLGVPVIGARYGVARANTQLIRAFKDFAIGKGSVTGANLTADERAAMQEAYNSGLIDKSQAHDLAGVGDTGVQYSAVRQKAMGFVSWFFHQAEKLNREVTALAAYRAARDAGKTHQQAVDEAHELTWKTHFDYSNSNRPRIMQNDFAKVALVFRNFQINMLYRLFRDIHQSIKGESPQLKKEARMQLVGIMGMMALNAGVKGLPFYSLAMILMGLAFDDDDEPFTFEERMRGWTIDIFGPELGGLLLNGIPGHYLGVDLTNRVGMPDLWFRSPNRDLQGSDEYQYWLSQALGAVPAIGESIWRGTQIAIDGNVARGIETASPKVVKDVLKAWRFAQEGATTLKGEAYLAPDEIGTWAKIAQAIGFTPAALVETYERNNALKNAEQRILNQRRQLLNEFALTRKLGDTEANTKVRERIKEFNQSFPRVRITGDTLLKSLQARRRTSQRTQDGILLDKRLDRQLRREMPEYFYREESR